MAGPGSAEDRKGNIGGTGRCALPYAEPCSPQSFLLVCQDVFLVGLADEMLRSRILQLCSVILLSGERSSAPSPQAPEL